MGLLSDESSDISSVESDSPETENDDESVADEPSLPPTKRQKLGDGSRGSSSAHVEPEPEPENDPSDDEQDHDEDLAGDISSDTSGDVPNSPINAKLDEEEFQEQVTICAWDGCKAGDLGDMDRLVKHIRNDHIENRQKKYTCEWRGCPRMSMPHASGYALKAHMRSHTREKPFHCYLPECDRAFTRSDALAKHMRTVHETEALRPSDPIPKSMQSQSGSKGKQLKIVLKQANQPTATDDTDDDDDDASQDPDSDFFTKIGVSQGFTDDEASLDVESLWKVMVAHVKWGLEDRETMIKECKRLEDVYKKAWLEKEVLLEQVLKIEEDWWQRRQVVLAAEEQARAQLASEALSKQSIEDDQATADDAESRPTKRKAAVSVEADDAAEEEAERAMDNDDEGDDAMEE